MSRASWKDFKIDPLQGDEIPSKDPTAEKKYKKPTKKQYLRWLVSFKNALQALGLAWITLMATMLTFTEGTFVPLVDPKIEDDQNSVFFKLKVVEPCSRFLSLRTGKSVTISRITVAGL